METHKELEGPRRCRRRRMSTPGQALLTGAFGSALLGVLILLGCHQTPLRNGEKIVSNSRLDLNQVTLPAVDLEESIDFYTRFGLRIIVDSPESDYARFEIPESESTLSLHVVSDPVNDPSAHIYFETTNPEEVVSRLREQGIEPVLPLENKSWLWQEAWFVDPAGNRICVYFAGENRKNPPWRAAP